MKKFYFLFLCTAVSAIAFAQNNPPAQPSVFVPADGAVNVTSDTLKVLVTDPELNHMRVTFMGRVHPAISDSANFTIIAIPDVQFYTSQLNGGSNSIFKAQTQWIVDSMAAKKIRYAVQLGDCVQNGDNGGNDIEWKRADTAFRKIEDPLNTAMVNGLPYGVCVGNHDQSPNGSASGSTTFYNQYFGASRFAGRNYYGGHYGANSDDHYQLFTADGLDFIDISLEYDPAADTMAIHWADSLLGAYPDRRGIISSHWLINPDSSWGAQGAAIYNKLKYRPNLQLMLCGHVNPNGEARRTDTFQGRTVYTFLSDYQDRANGGNGWMRIMEFSPATDQVSVKTYSPTLQQYETDNNSQFVLGYNMSGYYDTIGTAVNVSSGTLASVVWNGLQNGVKYDWYAVISDSTNEITTPVKRFTFLVLPSSAPGVVINPGRLELYPNPNDGKDITISYSRNVQADVSIEDITGKTVFRKTMNIGAPLRLPAMLDRGTYIIHVATEGIEIKKKFIVR